MGHSIGKHFNILSHVHLREEEEKEEEDEDEDEFADDEEYITVD